MIISLQTKTVFIMEAYRVIQTMKQPLFLLFLCSTLLAACGTYRQKAQQDKAQRTYIQFINPEGDYPDGVEVYINNTFSYIAMVAKDKDHSTTKDRWPVASGKIRLKVVYEGSVVYQGNFVLDPGETKQIVLPKHAY